jgi:hypothetical protein
MGRATCWRRSPSCRRWIAARYATLGFTDEANLDEGPTWPVAFAVKELTADVEARIGELVRRAAG